MTLRTVLVALDESVCGASPVENRSQHVMNALGYLQLSAESKIVLCYVLLPDSSQSDRADLPHQDIEELPYRRIEKQLQLYQQQLACLSEIEIVTGEPVTEIVRLAHIYHCDLIVVGSRGLKGVSRIIQGSIGSQVVNEAPCSVLVVKN